MRRAKHVGGNDDCPILATDLKDELSLMGPPQLDPHCRLGLPGTGWLWHRDSGNQRRSARCRAHGSNRDEEFHPRTASHLPGCRATIRPRAEGSRYLSLSRATYLVLRDQEVRSRLHRQSITHRPSRKGRRTYHVLVLKAQLAVPDTSAFIHLDCKCWGAENERDLLVAMSSQGSR